MQKPKPTLREQLSYYKPETLIKIGCKDGSNFFFVGTVGEWRDFDQTAAFEKMVTDFNNALLAWKRSPATKESQDRLVTTFGKVVRWKPFDSRTVVSVDNSTVGQRKIIILTGADSGDLDGVDLPPLKDVNDEGAMNLVKAVYTDGAKKLTSMYRGDHRASATTRKFEQTTAGETKKTLERFFMENRFGLLDGKVVIEECRKRAKEK